MEVIKYNFEGDNVLGVREALLNYSSAVFNKKKETLTPACLRIKLVIPEDWWVLIIKHCVFCYLGLRRE